MHSDAIGRNKLPCVPRTHWHEKARGGAKVQVTGHRSGHRSQVTGYKQKYKNIKNKNNSKKKQKRNKANLNI